MERETRTFADSRTGLERTIQVPGKGGRRNGVTTGPHSGRTRRPAPAMSPAQVQEMFDANVDETTGEKIIEWGGPGDGVALGAAVDNDTLDQRIADGYYQNRDTPEELLSRVRGKLATCTDPDERAMGESIVETLYLDGETGLSKEQLDWVPTRVPYAGRAALEAKIQGKLDAINRDLPADIAAEIDDDFANLMDAGGQKALPTQRKGLFTKLMSWMWGSAEHIEVEIDHGEEKNR